MDSLDRFWAERTQAAGGKAGVASRKQKVRSGGDRRPAGSAGGREGRNETPEPERPSSGQVFSFTDGLPGGSEGTRWWRPQISHHWSSCGLLAQETPQGRNNKRPFSILVAVTLDHRVKSNHSTRPALIPFNFLFQMLLWWMCVWVTWACGGFFVFFPARSTHFSTDILLTSNPIFQSCVTLLPLLLFFCVHFGNIYESSCVIECEIVERG